MNTNLELAPLALGVALSPAPVLAVGTMLLAHRATRASLGFLAGWAVGIAALTAVAAAVSASVSPSDGVVRVSYLIELAFGIGLLMLAVRYWRARPPSGSEPATPGWLLSAATFGPGRAALLGVLLVVANPKVIPLCLTAGHRIGEETVDTPGAIVVLVFTLAAASTVIAPTIAQVVAGRRMRPRLEAIQRWLIARGAIVVSATLAAVGLLLVATAARGL